MENLKIKVLSDWRDIDSVKNESIEIRSLFSDLGFDLQAKGINYSGESFFYTLKNELRGCCAVTFSKSPNREITLPELRDMVALKRESLNDKIATAEIARQEEKHSHYKKDVSHLSVIDPYRISDLYGLHPCADHIMKKSLCAGNRGHKDALRDIQDIIDTAERWKQMIEEDNNEL